MGAFGSGTASATQQAARRTRCSDLRSPTPACLEDQGTCSQCTAASAEPRLAAAGAVEPESCGGGWKPACKGAPSSGAAGEEQCRGYGESEHEWEWEWEREQRGAAASAGAGAGEQSAAIEE